MGVATGTENKTFQMLQVSLNELAVNTSPDQLMPQIGMLEAVTSQANTGGLASLQFEVLNGKDKPQNSSGKPYVQVKVQPPTCNYTTSGSKNICDADTGDADTSEYYNITVDQDAWREFTIDYSTFANLNETPDQRIALRLAQHANDILVEINNSLVTLAYAQVGDYSDSVDSASSPKSVSLINTAGTYQPLAWSKVVTDYRKNGFNGKPIAVGGSKLETAMMSAMFQGTGQFTSPYNPALPITAFTDYLIDSTLNNSTENMLTWMPGTVRMVEWFKNDGYNAINLEVHKAGKFNYMGYEFDLDITYICDKKYKFTLSKQYGLFHPTVAMYGDCWKGGLLAWELGCTGLDCTDF